MEKKKKVLFISQEIMPYMPENQISRISRNLPQGIQERGKEIRAFMPKYGIVNERRHQLHEVIRLSGMNIIIDDTDHSLVIKVASIQSARMQVYFIDNDDFFHRKSVMTNEKGQFFDDNDERTIFFARGVLETVKKLRWSPDIIHCHGWLTSIVPLYIKKSFREDPLFKETKVIYSIYDENFEPALNKNFAKKLAIDGITEEETKIIENPSYININKLAINLSDGIIYGDSKINPELEKYLIESGKPYLNFYNEETYIEAHSQFYDKILKNS